MTLNGMMWLIPLTIKLSLLSLSIAFSVHHFFTLSFHDFSFSRTLLALLVDRLR
jgi:hypothetical protein